MVVGVIQALNELGKTMFLGATLYLPPLRFSTESMRWAEGEALGNASFTMAHNGLYHQHRNRAAIDQIAGHVLQRQALEQAQPVSCRRGWGEGGLMATDH